MVNDDATRNKRGAIEELMQEPQHSLKRQIEPDTKQLQARNIALQQREYFLREHNYRLQAALSAASIGTFSYNSLTKHWQWDQKVDALFGRTTRSTTADLSRLFEGIHHADRLEFLKAVARASKKATIYRIEFRVIWPDGSVRWLQANGRTVGDDKDVAVHMTGALMDVTHYKEQEERLRESEHRFRVLSHAIPAMVWTYTADGREQYFNDSWSRYTGLSEQDSLSGGWMTALHPDDHDQCVARWREAVTKAEAYLTECRYRHHDGEYRWHVVRALPEKRSDGSVAHWVAVAVDIEEHRRMEEALRQSTQALGMAQQGAHAGTWDWDIASERLHYSPEYHALYGWTGAGDDVSYEHWLQCVHADDRARANHDIRKAAELNGTLNSEFRIVRPDGAIRWLWGKGKAFCDAQGRPTRMVGITFDITARKQAEAHIVRLLAEAEQREQDLREKQAQLVQAAKLASIGELATGVAHEINNPLNNISLCAGNLIDAVQAGSANDGMLVFELQLITAQVEKAALIVDHLRCFGRVAGLQRTALRVHDVVRSALSLMREQLRLRNIQVETHWAPEDPHVQGNALQIEQVMLNLLTNARDAVSLTPAKIITLSTAVDEDWVFIRVMDTGIGMSEDVKKRIFDPFFTTKDVGKGTGLGLSLSYGIIKDHEGTFTVESHPEQGSTFIVQLPRSTTLGMGDTLGSHSC